MTNTDKYRIKFKIHIYTKIYSFEQIYTAIYYHN